MIPAPAVEHYRKMQRLQSIAILAAQRAWAGVDAGDLSGSWQAALPEVAAAVSLVQESAAGQGASYGAATLAAQGLYEAPQHFVNTKAFAGFASDGRSLAGLLYAAVPKTKGLIAGGMDPRDAIRKGGDFLSVVTQTTIADSGRAAAGVDTATRKNVGYVRMLNPPSCSRCSILAGRFYRWNNGFKRHPKCDCVHVQTTATAAAESEGLIHDPYEYFQSLPAAEQDRTYGKAEAQAIRDGSDIFQVVNARRGVKPGGLVTTEGTTKRGNFGRNGPRLTPEAIYSKGLSRAETLSELERYGYILPGGQNPTGVIRGQVEGFGALGRGGTRVGVRNAVEEARRTGVRDPLQRATMTAAERRLFDAQLNWGAVRAGRNPLGKAPLTPTIAAQVEKDFRRWLSTGGQVFK